MSLVGTVVGVGTAVGLVALVSETSATGDGGTSGSAGAGAGLPVDAARTVSLITFGSPSLAGVEVGTPFSAVVSPDSG